MKDGDVPAAPGQLLGRQARDGGAAAAVVPAKRGDQQPAGASGGVGGAARNGHGARRGRDRRGALAQRGRQTGHRQQPLLQRVGEAQQRLALGIGGIEHGPVELGDQVAQAVEVDRVLEGTLDVGELTRPRGLVGGVGAVAADGDERAACDVAEAELASSAQEEVEVVGQRVAVVVAAHGLVDASVHHARGVDEVVVAAEERLHQGRRRELRARPHAGLAPVGVDHDRVAVDHSGLGVAIEDLDLAADAARQAEIVIADHRDQLAPALRDERVVRGGDAAVGLVAHDAQARLVGEGPQHLVGLRVGGAVEHHEDLQVGEVLVQRAANRLGEVVVAVVGRDPQRDTRRRSIEGHTVVIGSRQGALKAAISPQPAGTARGGSGTRWRPSRSSAARRSAPRAPGRPWTGSTGSRSSRCRSRGSCSGP